MHLYVFFHFEDMLQSYHISPLFLATNCWTVGTVVIKPAHHDGPNWYNAVSAITTTAAHMVLGKENKLWQSKFVIAKIQYKIPFQIYPKQWPYDNIKFNNHLEMELRNW